jgi:hypothetical protein
MSSPPSGPTSSADDPNRALLAEFLRHNTAPCAVCGYELHNLSGDICPECGHQFALRIGASHARIGWLVVCLAPMLMMFGLAVFLMAMTIRYGVPGDEEWYCTLLAGGLVDGAVALALLLRYVAFLQLAESRQALLAMLSCVINGLVFGAALVI